MKTNKPDIIGMSNQLSRSEMRFIIGGLLPEENCKKVKCCQGSNCSSCVKVCDGQAAACTVGTLTDC